MSFSEDRSSDGSRRPSIDSRTLSPPSNQRTSSAESIAAHMNESQVHFGGEDGTTKESLEFLEKLRRKTRNSIAQHRLASEHFSSRQFTWFFMPQVILGLIASILSFLSDSTIILDDYQSSRFLQEDNTSPTQAPTPGSGFSIESIKKAHLTTAVGIISLIVVAFQTVSREKQFGERGVMHRIAAESFHHLENELDNLIALYSMNEPHQKLEGVKKVLLQYQRRYREVEVGCKSPLPIQLANAFILLESNIDCSAFEDVKGNYNHSSDEFHKFATQILCQEICAYYFYPLWLGRADTMVYNATKRVNSRLHEMTAQELKLKKKMWRLEEEMEDGEAEFKQTQKEREILRGLKEKRLDHFKNHPKELEKNIRNRRGKRREKVVNAIKAGRKKAWNKDVEDVEDAEETIDFQKTLDRQNIVEESEGEEQEDEERGNNDQTENTNEDTKIEEV